MRAAGIKEIYMYIYRQKETVAQYITTFPIMYLCMDTGIRPGL